MSLSSDRGSRSSCNDPHIHSRHIQGAGEHSYAVDGDKDPSQASTTTTPNSVDGIWKFAEYLDYCCTETTSLSRDWGSRPSLDPLQTYARCWRIFICCGWTSGSIIIHMLWVDTRKHQHASTQQCIHILEICWNPGLLLRTENNLIVQWLRLQTHIEWSPYPLEIYKVLESIHMLWVDTRIHHHANINTTMWTYFGNLHLSWTTAPYCKHLYCHCAVIEAPDPHGMIPTSSPNMCNVIDIIHMLYVHIDPPSSCCYHCNDWVGFGKLEEQHQWVLCIKIMVMEWLRLQTHTEWFQHPLQTYKMWLTLFTSRTCLSWSYHCNYYWFRFEKSAKIIK